MSGRTFLLQDWTTIRSSLTQPFTQDPIQWLDLNAFGDVVCWIDVAEVTPPGGSSANSVGLQIQTSPSADDAYFSPLAPTINYGTASPYFQASSTPFIVRSAKSLTTNNLMRYLRWQLTPTGSGTYDTTFRIRVVANRSPTFVPTLIAGCVLWLRADYAAVTPGTNNVTGWNDQSPSNDPNKNMTTGSATKPTVTAADVNYFNQPTLSFAGSAYMTSPSWASTLVQPDTWIVVGHPATINAQQVALEANDMVSGQNIQQNAVNQISIATSMTLTSTTQWTAPGVVLAEFFGGSSNIFFNNFTGAVKTGNAGSGANTGQGSLTLGSADIAWNPGGLHFWNGTIAEVIAYNSILSTSAKSQLRGYLHGRYGLTIG